MGRGDNTEVAAGRGDGLQRVIQFWKIQANDIATRRFCTLKKIVDVINYAR
jgi:hypothetical protein